MCGINEGDRGLSKNQIKIFGRIDVGKNVRDFPTFINLLVIFFCSYDDNRL